LRAPSKPGDPYRFFSPVWSPDGSQIALSRAGKGTHSLWVMDGDGSNARRLVADLGVSYFDSPAVAW
jgi:Tol biopolymer transport system component